MRCAFLAVCGFALLVPPASAADNKPAPSFADVRPLLETHCNRCHGDKSPKGGINLAAIADEKTALARYKTWRRVVVQVEGQEMPPSGQPKLADDQRTRMVAWLKQTLDPPVPADPALRHPGWAVTRRLTRFEYDRTLRDLLGIDFNSGNEVGLPDDAAGEQFDNLAESLNLPPILLEKYFAAADKALGRLFDARAKAARDKILFVKPGGDVTATQAVRQIVERFARRAYRRPVTEAEIDRLMKLHERAAAKGDDFENAARLPLKAVLVSPHFLLRAEQDREPAGSPRAYRVSDPELAVRLSYFLWSSMPDEALAKLAEEGKLSDPGVLEKEVGRMLADPKARALTDSFATQWLQLKKLGQARPSTEFFPTFTPQLRRAMGDEVTTFFDKLRQENRSVLELLDADYTYVNQELAKHYGIANVTGAEFRKVLLPADSHRGGLMSMAAFLALNAHTSRTSPTLRGKWVLGTLLGDPPPPPPPDAGSLKEENEKGKEPKSFRELMAQHSRNGACAACHKKIDPLGYGLEKFDAIGRWRDSHGGQPIDAAGKLPSGEAFNGPDELKKVLWQRKAEFVANLAEQLLTYSLGRELHAYDQPALKEITAALEKNQYSFLALAAGIARSFPFQYRRNSDAPE